MWDQIWLSRSGWQVGLSSVFKNAGFKIEKSIENKLISRKRGSDISARVLNSVSVISWSNVLKSHLDLFSSSCESMIALGKGGLWAKLRKLCWLKCLYDFRMQDNTALVPIWHTTQRDVLFLLLRKKLAWLQEHRATVLCGEGFSVSTCLWQHWDLRKRAQKDTVRVCPLAKDLHFFFFFWHAVGL